MDVAMLMVVSSVTVDMRMCIFVSGLIYMCMFMKMIVCMSVTVFVII